MISALLPLIYLAFISLGLPDALLGSAWPVMGEQFGVPVSWAGPVSMVISVGTITSALLSDRLTKRFGAGNVTAISVATTAFALVGFSFASAYWMLFVWAIPYGLGAGAVDAALNNYVALHYESRHMSWLHCMWGIGAAVGPSIMGFALTGGYGWPWGYRIIGILQCVLTAVLVFSLPMWRKQVGNGETEHDASQQQSQEIDHEQGRKPTQTQHHDQTQGQLQDQGNERQHNSIVSLSFIPGAKAVFIMFFCYCAIESTAGLWASSFMVTLPNIDKETAATWASLFYIGITVGRLISGFVTMRYCDATMIRFGQAILLVGCLLVLASTLFMPMVVVGLVLIGLGCAPIYPCIIHSTPAYFGAHRSQAMIGVQMASAYVGSMLMPPVFGALAKPLSMTCFPWFLLALLILMACMHERLLAAVRR